MKAREIQGRHNDISIVGIEPGSGSFQLCLVEERTHSSGDENITGQLSIMAFNNKLQRLESIRKRS